MANKLFPLPIQETPTGLYQYIPEDAETEDQPGTLKMPISKSGLRELYAMTKIESTRSIIVTLPPSEEARSPSLPKWNMIGHESGAVVEFLTNYGFYCTGRPDRFMVLMGLFSQGPPPDCRRMVSGRGQMPMRILSPTRLPRTNLLIVPSSSFHDWRDALDKTFLIWHSFDKSEDLETFANKEKQTPFEELKGVDVILVSSAIHQTLQKYYQNCYWARTVIEESKTHPRTFNNKNVVFASEFDWFIASDPLYYITEYRSRARYAAQGIVVSEHYRPEFFFVGSHPGAIDMTDIPSPVKSERVESLHSDLGRLSLENSVMLKMSALEWSEVAQGRLDDHIRNTLEVLRCLFDLSNYAYLNANQSISKLIASHPLVDSFQESVLRHVIGDTVATIFNSVERMYAAFEKRKKEEMELMVSTIADLEKGFLQAALAIKQDFLMSFTEKINQRLGENVTVGPDTQNVIPIYAILRFAGTEPSEEESKVLPSLIYPGYAPVFGCVAENNIFTDKKVVRRIAAALGLIEGTLVRVELEEGVECNVVIGWDGRKVKDPRKLWEKKFCIPCKEGLIQVGPSVLHHKTQLRVLARINYVRAVTREGKTKYLQGLLMPETTITLVTDE